ncbi:MAG: hypothetical protein KGL39_14840 [Patescibacteria group bacterium]|nr:hypothetical protein [Patescibacteria group bacterium]
MKLKAYSYSTLGQSLLDIAIKVGAVAVVTFLNAVATAVSNGGIQIPGGAFGITLVGLVVSQLDSFFVQWTA